jgi:hypothetical protein
MNKQTNNKRQNGLCYAVWLVLLAVGLGFVWSAANIKLKEVNHVAEAKPSAAIVELFLQEELPPQLRTYAEKNRQAAERALQKTDEHFLVYRNGVPKFSRELTGLRTRFRLINRLRSDKWDSWWYGRHHSHRALDFVEEIFSQNVVSQNQLQADLESVIVQYQNDLEANRNQFLFGLEQSIRSSELMAACELNTASQTELNESIQGAINDLISEMGADSVSVMVLSNLGGEVAAFAGTRIIISGLSYLGSVAVASGGSTLTGATAGSGGGTLISPGLGTVIGFGVGIVAGVAVDWYLTDQFREDINLQTETFLEQMQNLTLHGNGDSWMGLENLLNDSALLAQQSAAQAVATTLRGELL